MQLLVRALEGKGEEEAVVGTSVQVMLLLLMMMMLLLLLLLLLLPFVTPAHIVVALAGIYVAFGRREQALQLYRWWWWWWWWW